MEQLRPSDFALYRSPSAVKVAPDEKKLAFVVKQADIERNDYSSSLYVHWLEEATTQQLGTSRDVAVFDWRSDSQRLLVCEWPASDARTPPSTRVYEAGLDGGNWREVALVPGRAIGIRWLDEERLLYAAKVELSEQSANPNGEADVLVADEVPFVRDGEGFTNKIRTHLHLYDITRKTAEDLTPGFTDVEGFDVRDQRVVLTANIFENLASVHNAIYLLSLTDRTLSRLTDEAFLFEGVRFAKDDVVVALGSSLREFGSRQNKEVMALRLADRVVQSLTPGWDRSLRRGAMSTDIRMRSPSFTRVAGDNPMTVVDGERYYCVTTVGYASSLNAVDLDGNVRQIAGGSGSVDDFDVKGETVAWAGIHGTRLQEVYVLTGGTERQATRLNQAVLTNKKLSTPEHFSVRAPNTELELDAWVLKPTDYVAGRRYPAVLEIHGGPKAAFSDIYQHAHQVLANQGYAVIFTNPRGSDGRGNTFHADIRGNFGVFDYDDILAVVDSALERFDFIDAERLGVTGISYGGYMTNWIVGHTDRFKAAVSTVGVSDFISHFGTSEIGYYWDEDYMTVGLWDGMDKWWFHSPLRYADRVKTPTLFLHADQCYECGLPQSLELFTALKHFGIDSRLCIFKGGAHGFAVSGKPSHRLRYWDELLGWFDKYLKPSPA